MRKTMEIFLCASVPLCETKTIIDKLDFGCGGMYN